MQSEIGSIFSINSYRDTQDIHRKTIEGTHLYSLCREALLNIAQNYSGERRVILLPAYTCKSVVAPFAQENWKISFYSIDTRLCIDSKSFLSLLYSVNPGVVLFHPYYGKKLNKKEINLLIEAKNKGVMIVQDLTQSIFSEKTNVYSDITVGSIRKWAGIPDGAFLAINNGVDLEIAKPNDYYSAFTKPQLDAMYLRGEYFRTGKKEYKEISIRLNKYAEKLVDNQLIGFHKISNYTFEALINIDIDMIKSKRNENFKTLLNLIKSNEQASPVFNTVDELDSAPIYFPLYVENREKFQRLLAENNIYAPVLWKVEDNSVIVDESVEYIYKHLLAIPIDQRYSFDDMKRIADVINEICCKLEDQ